MQRWDDLEQVPPGFGPSVVTLGNFDGVHLGHRSVLADVVARARLRGAAAVAVTFDPHPLQVLYPDSAPAPLTGLDHRIELMAETGLDATLVMEFTRELARGARRTSSAGSSPRPCPPSRSWSAATSGSATATPAT